MLTFDPGPHKYFWNGVPVPSVTEILSPLTDLSFVDADVLRRAQAFGTAVHYACELHDTGRLDEEALDPELAPYLAGWRKFCSEHACTWDLIEQRVYHPTLRYAGTLHDVGKLGVPTRVLQKAGKLTEAEFESIQQHPARGREITKDLEFLGEAIEGGPGLGADRVAPRRRGQAIEQTGGRDFLGHVGGRHAKRLLQRLIAVARAILRERVRRIGHGEVHEEFHGVPFSSVSKASTEAGVRFSK